MARTWIRLYTDLRHNPKIQRLPDHLFRFVINCWCLIGASNNESLPALDEIAFELRIDPGICQAYIDHLIEQNILIRRKHSGMLTGYHWDDRQFVSDSSTDRVRKYREKQEKQDMKRFGNVTVTVQDSDSDSETEQNQIRSRAEDGADPAPLDGISFEDQFRKCVKMGGYTMEEEIGRKLAGIALQAKAEPSQAAVCYLNFYHRAHNTNGVRDGEAYLIGGFKQELRKLKGGRHA